MTRTSNQARVHATATPPRPRRAPASLAVVALTTLWAPTTASAHQIWLEQDAKGDRPGKLCFGEYAENMREVSPGRLDKFVSPTATLLSARGEKTLALSKTGDGFALPTRVGSGESLIARDLGYPIISRKAPPAAGGAPAKADAPALRTMWTPAARFITDFRAQPAKLTLDVVPTGKVGEFQVVFRGKPLPEAKVGIAAASGWGLEGETDKDGKVSFALPWKSGYLIKIHHVDATPGQRKAAAPSGKAGEDEGYDSASYSTTLSFITPTGLAAPPPPPARKPSAETAPTTAAK